MADLITHTCTAIVYKALRNQPHVATFVAGTCLPDLVGRVPAMALTTLRWKWTWIPEPLIYIFNPIHLPIGIVLFSAFVALFYPAHQRGWAFRNLLGGGILHLMVDLLQSHFGVGYLLLFPFSLWDWELGWIGSEDTVRIVPFLLPLTVGLSVWRWGRRPNATHTHS